MDDLGTACENSDDTSNAHGKQTIGVLYWVLERTMSRKSDALGTRAIDFSPLVDILTFLRHAEWRCKAEIKSTPARVRIAQGEEKEG